MCPSLLRPGITVWASPGRLDTRGVAPSGAGFHMELRKGTLQLTPVTSLFVGGGGGGAYGRTTPLYLFHFFVTLYSKPVGKLRLG